MNPFSLSTHLSLRKYDTVNKQKYQNDSLKNKPVSINLFPLTTWYTEWGFCVWWAKGMSLPINWVWNRRQKADDSQIVWCQSCPRITSSTIKNRRQTTRHETSQFFILYLNTHVMCWPSNWSQVELNWTWNLYKIGMKLIIRHQLFSFLYFFNSFNSRFFASFSLLQFHLQIESFPLETLNSNRNILTWVVSELNDNYNEEISIKIKRHGRCALV